MKEIYLNDNDFSNLKFTILSKDLEGTLLLKQGSYLYKLYNKKLAKKKEPLIDALMELNIDNCVIPDAKIYLKNKFRAIRMVYYSQYQTLLKTLKGNIDLQSRLSLCKKALTAIKNLYNHGIAYYDIHTENILVYNDDIKLVDLDSSTLLTSCNKQKLQNINQLIKINSVILILSCFHKIDFHDVIAENDNMDIKNLLSPFLIDKNLKFYIDQFMNEEDIKFGFEFLLDFFVDEKVKKLKRVNMNN